jgi:hypothetical protein
MIEARHPAGNDKGPTGPVDAQTAKLADWTILKGRLGPGLNRIENGYVGHQHEIPFVGFTVDFRATLETTRSILGNANDAAIRNPYGRDPPTLQQDLCGRFSTCRMSRLLAATFKSSM